MKKTIPIILIIAIIASTSQICFSQSTTNDKAIAQLLLGASLASKGEYVKAVQHYDAAIKLNPNMIDAYSNRALANETYVLILIESGYQTQDMKDRLTQTLNDYHKVIKLDPNNAKAYYGVCFNTLLMNKTEGICFYCKKAYSLGYAKAQKIIQKMCN